MYTYRHMWDASPHLPLDPPMSIRTQTFRTHRRWEESVVGTMVSPSLPLHSPFSSHLLPFLVSLPLEVDNITPLSFPSVHPLPSLLHSLSLLSLPLSLPFPSLPLEVGSLKSTHGP